MGINSLLIVLLFSSAIKASPLGEKNGRQTGESDVQWSSVPEVDESSMSSMINSMMEMIKSQLSSWMYGVRSADDVEVDSSGGFMSMIHGLFSRLSNMAMDMMGQMRKLRDRSDRLQDPNGSGESDSEVASNNSTTLSTRFKNQIESTRDRIKEAWNTLMKKYNNITGSSSAAMTMKSSLNPEDQLIDETRANRNLKSNNRRVIRSLDINDGSNRFEVFKSSALNSLEPKMFDKLVSLVDQFTGKTVAVQGRSKQSDSLFSLPSDDRDLGKSSNIFDRMKGAMDNARSKFFGAIGKFMNGTMMTNEDETKTLTNENDAKNWWQMFKPKNDKPEREPLYPRELIPTKKPFYPSMIPKETSSIRPIYLDLPSMPSTQKSTIDWTTRYRPKVTTPSKFDLDSGSPSDDDPSRATIEFMDKFKGEIERVKSSMETSSNDNLEMAMAKIANWGLFIRSISESKNLDDFWGKISQQVV